MRETGDIECRGSGNYAFDEAKEIARLKRELRDAQDALDVLKKSSPSNAEQRREAVKAKIKDIYDGSKQNYGAPKIAKELRKSGEIISERTVGKYMRQMGIKAQWVKPWTVTTKNKQEMINDYNRRFLPVDAVKPENLRKARKNEQ